MKSASKILISIVLMATPILAQVPYVINYHTLLTDPNTGLPIPDNTMTVVFSIYDVPSNGAAIWSETHDLQFKDGICSVLLGTVNPLTPTIFDGSQKFLGVKVGSDPEMTPRQRIVSVAFAVVSADANNLGGLPATDYATNTALMASDGTPPNVGSNMLSWDNLTDVPTGFADGADDVSIGGGNTLDQAYDQGGPGQGKDITADAGAVNIVGADGLTVDGKVGIGTTTPNQKLDVTGSADVVGLGVGTSGYNSAYGDLVVSNVGQNSSIAIFSSTGRRFILEGGFDSKISQSNSGAIDFNTGADITRLRIGEDGHIGIGTISPAGDLHVEGDKGVVFEGALNPSSPLPPPVEGAGTRMMWYPQKAAFRAGDVPATRSTAWNAENIGFNSIAMGLGTTANGNSSTAIGTHANTNGKEGAFVYGDASSPNDVMADADNQFVVRAAGGAIFYSDGLLTSGVQLAAGGNSWSVISDSAKKESFRLIDGEAVLEKLQRFKLGTWNYKGQEPQRFRHYGPMAQDFFDAFGYDGVGTIGNDTTIACADFHGVNFTAIQALEKRTRELQAKAQELADLKKVIERQEKELTKIRSEFSALKATMVGVIREMKNNLSDAGENGIPGHSHLASVARSSRVPSTDIVQPEHRGN